VIFSFNCGHLLQVQFFDLFYFLVEIVRICLHLVQGGLRLEVMGLDVFLPNLVELALKILTLLSKTFKLDLELEASFISFFSKSVTLGHSLCHGVDLVSFEIILNLILSHR